VRPLLIGIVVIALMGVPVSTAAADSELAEGDTAAEAATVQASGSTAADAAAATSTLADSSTGSSDAGAAAPGPGTDVGPVTSGGGAAVATPPEQDGTTAVAPASTRPEVATDSPSAPAPADPGRAGDGRAAGADSGRAGADPAAGADSGRTGAGPAGGAGGNGAVASSADAESTAGADHGSAAPVPDTAGWPQSAIAELATAAQPAYAVAAPAPRATPGRASVPSASAAEVRAGVSPRPALAKHSTPQHAVALTGRCAPTVPFGAPACATPTHAGLFARAASSPLLPVATAFAAASSADPAPRDAAADRTHRSKPPHAAKPPLGHGRHGPFAPPGRTLHVAASSTSDGGAPQSIWCALVLACALFAAQELRRHRFLLAVPRAAGFALLGERPG
jgi:hypothetical protein